MMMVSSYLFGYLSPCGSLISVSSQGEQFSLLSWGRQSLTKADSARAVAGRDPPPRGQPRAHLWGWGQLRTGRHMGGDQLQRGPQPGRVVWGRAGDPRCLAWLGQGLRAPGWAVRGSWPLAGLGEPGEPPGRPSRVVTVAGALRALDLPRVREESGFCI